MVKRIPTPNSKSVFRLHTFLSTTGRGRFIESFAKGSTIFTQGDKADGLFFIQSGKVQLSIVSNGGKEATLGILSSGECFGEGGLAGQLLRVSSAIAVTKNCVLLRVNNDAMTAAMDQEPVLSAWFIKLLLKRNIRYQDDLVDQLFNSSERRLARVLLLMAQFGEEGVSEMTVPRLSQETLAEMVGTTRSRVSFFMNRFRKLGFIDYNLGDTLHIYSSLLKVVLNDDEAAPSAGKTGLFFHKGQGPPTKPNGTLEADGARSAVPSFIC
ncbi:MAG TPA: Crp/Fnr family transcriptional regulator [Candidatus Sulfotelmatobacter sp.]|nr:Crp/Fnr family transcriptional regulator [Candidatus Sulfotelmatobacter sp.]